MIYGEENIDPNNCSEEKVVEIYKIIKGFGWRDENTPYQETYFFSNDPPLEIKHNEALLIIDRAEVISKDDITPLL